MNSRALRSCGWAVCLGACLALPSRAASSGTFESAQGLLRQYCRSCHEGARPAGGFHVESLAAPESLLSSAARWLAVQTRVRNGEMPPKNAPAPSLAAREQLVAWIETSLRAAACASGEQPGPALTRRLNRDEYAATLRDLLDIHMDWAHALPADGAGGEGFDNAAETLFLSPLHSEKYMEVAKFAIDFAAKEYKSRVRILVAQPGPGVTPQQAARRILTNFLPKAFRRPVTPEDVAPYLELFNAALRRGQSFEQAVFFALRAVLVSPLFLFRVEPVGDAEPGPLDPFALASRISYFLWGSMPDELLFDVAAAGKLHDPEVLKPLIPRLLRHDRSLAFAQRFTEQWLRTRELGVEKTPDPKLFPAYAEDEELRGDIRFQPILFFRELLIRNLSLLNLLDSRYTIGTSNLEKHYGIKLPLKATARKQPQWVELPEGSHRGGVLGMAAVLTVSSYPYRTSPVLRGAWILDSILGTPPPPPPPNVPALEEQPGAGHAKSVRQRLMQHRANAVCASCHDRIDPLGFALENYDPIGRWRDDDAGQPIDNSAELAGNVKFQGPAGLRAVLLERKDAFIRNLTSRMLGYALGRGLTLQDSCTVDAIVEQLRQNEYKAQTLIEAIVLSKPFRYQAGTRTIPSKEQSKR